MSTDADYKETLKNLITFLKDASIAKIIFHQFDFLIMYFPVYMVYFDLKENGIDIKFENCQNIEKDEKLFEWFETLESFDLSNSTFNIGLFEPVRFNQLYEEDPERCDVKKKKSLEESYKYKKDEKLIEKKGSCYLLHMPFINFPPLYGVALKNRPVINKIKRNKIISEKGGKVSIMDYWDHFSSKLSLLERDDFNKYGLSTSLYEKGSTTDWFIRDWFRFQPSLMTWLKVEYEFQDLFTGLVDVAFTIQPWVAVTKSELENPPVDIDIVYKSQCVEYSSTSLIFVTTKREYIYLLDYLLNCFNNLLKIKIEELYHLDTSELDPIIKEYCDLLTTYCKEHQNSCFCCSFQRMMDISSDEGKCGNQGKKDAEKSISDGCLFENKMALRLTNDSQIYKHLKLIKKEEMKIEEAVSKYFVEKFSNTPEGNKKFQELVGM